MRRLNIIRLFLGMILLVISQSLVAQIGPVSTSQEQMAQRELQRQGVDEAELKERLLEKGIDVSNMNAQELLAAKPQIDATVAEIKSEHEQSQQEKQAAEAAVEIIEDSIDEAEDVRELIEQGATAEEAKVEANLANELGANPEINTKIYGHHIFQNKTLDVFRATDRAKAPGTYVLDTGDELAISIFGASQTDLLLSIGKDGFIKPTGIPRIYLRGRTLNEARKLVKSRLANYYVFSDGQFSLSIDGARTVSISIYGEVKQSGTYTISALNGPLNALIAAGGPTERGSVRNIEFIRDGKKSTLDVYEFLENPGKNKQESLRDGDVINVPLAKKLVTIQGGVRRPMIYELNASQTLSKLIEYAGGTVSKAALDATRISRYSNGRIRVVNLNPNSFSNYDLKDGDVVEIPIVIQPIEDFVSVVGEVLVDGRFGYRPNLTIAEVLDIAGLKPTARRDVSFVATQNDDGTRSLQRLNISESSADLKKVLKRGDAITILAASRFTDDATFSVRGAVRYAIEAAPYPNDGKLNLEEAVLLGGGLKENSISEALIIRTPSNNPVEREYLRVDLADAKSFIIEPFDQVVIYTQEKFSDEQIVSISGAVRDELSTIYDPSLSVNDLLYLSGGLRFDASHDRIEVYRLSVDGKDAEILVETLSIGDNGEFNEDFKLEPFDKIVIRSIGEYEPIETVILSGEVKFPGLYARLEGQNRISDFIERAGGVSSDAFPAGTTLTRDGSNVIINLNEILAQPASPGNIILREGDEILIPKPNETVLIDVQNTYTNQYGADSLVINGFIEVAYQGDQKANWYVNNYAGGFTKDAKKNSVTVTGAAGDIVETKSFLGFRKYPKVKSGGKIYIPNKPPKKEKPSRERASWSEVAQVTIAAMTAIATLIVINNNNQP